MKNIAAVRFRILLVALGILSISLAAFASWRESSYAPSRSESAESNVLLNIAVKSIVPLSAGNRPDHAGSSFVTGLNESNAKRILESLAELDKKIEQLVASKRLKSLYTLDLDRLATEIKLARKEEKTLYGPDFDIAMGAILQLKIGTTLSQLTWREDLPENKRDSEYWHRNIARVHDSFLSRKNPWGALYGNLLVRDNCNEKNKASSTLFSISGHQSGSADGQPFEDVRKKYPGFSLAAEPVISDSMRAMLDYDDRRKLVDRNNHVLFGGKNVPAGYDVLLTINPALQELAGSLTDNELSGEHIKNATLVAMDVKTGEILAAASASENAAGQALIFRTVAPASTSKILFAAAMLEHPESLKNSQQTLSKLPYYLMISDPQRIFFTTAAFSGAAKPIMDQAARFGWNQDCSEKGEGCVGKPMDHLYGSVQKGTVSAPIAGRIMVAATSKNNNFRLLTDAELSQMPEYAQVGPLLERNQKRPDSISKEGYDAAKVVRMSMFGQGDARTSAFGLLHTISHVAGAANGQKEVVLPHLVSTVVSSAGKTIQTATPTAVSIGMKTENAKLLAGYLAAVNSPSGTAGGPFRKVFGRDLSGKEMLFAKTGTTDSTVVGSVPLYLYVAAYSRNGKEYDTAVVAICERKVKQGSNYNYAADLALRFIKATKAEFLQPKQIVNKTEPAKTLRQVRSKG